MSKTISEIDFWDDKPIAEGYVTIQYFFKWLVGKDIYMKSSTPHPQVFEDIMNRGFDQWFKNVSELIVFLMSFPPYWRIRVWTFPNGDPDTMSEFPYTLLISGLSHWDMEHPNEKYFECKNVLSKKRLTKLS